MPFPFFGKAAANAVVTEDKVWMEVDLDFFEIAFCLVMAWGFFVLLELDIIRRKLNFSSWTTEDGVSASRLLRDAIDNTNARLTAASGAREKKPYEKTSHKFIARYSGPKDDEMTNEQKKIRDAIVATRKRTGLSGPFGPWLAVPEIADPAQQLGRACRYGTSLSFQESELVILLTGAKTRSHAEFDIHVGEAIKSGWSMDLVNAIPRDDDWSLQAVKDDVLPLMENERQRAIAIYTAELLETYTISDETYESAKSAFGGQDSVLVEITSIAGYYTYVSYTLNSFRIPSK